jgi:hypothetical protein
MAHGTEPGGAPCAHEQVDLVPAVEADAKRIAFQDTVHLRESGPEPGSVAVIGDGAAAAVPVADDVGRIGQDKIDALRGHFSHKVDAVARA